MNTTKKLLVIISTLAIATAPAIASSHHFSKLSTNQTLIGAWSWIITEHEGGGASRLLDPGVFLPAQMPGGLVPKTGAGGVMGGPGVDLPTPQAEGPIRAPVN